MNKMSVFIVLGAMLSLSGCASSPSEVIHTSLNGYEYNSLSRNYQDRPTQVRVSEDALSIVVDGYGQDSGGVLTIKRADVDATIAAIDKYLKWDELATARGDIIKKNIDEVGGYTYAIIGVNTGYHLFLSHIPLLSDNLDSNLVGLLAVMFPREEAIELKDLLQKFKTNTIKRADMSVYN